MRTRTQTLLQSARSVLSRQQTQQRIFFSHTHNTRYPRRSPDQARPGCAHKRSSSFTAPAVAEQNAFAAITQGGTPPPPPEDPSGDAEIPKIVDAEKIVVRRARRTKAVEAEKDSSQSLPSDLDILWTPGVDIEYEKESPATLPPADIFHDALASLFISLHPQTQHKAAYPVSGTPLEPTVALYCPLEGGDYVIDATVRELARRTYSDVVVLDAVQLAAGEWGVFGKAASSLQLPHNPLHFRAPSTRSSYPGRQVDEGNDDYDFDGDEGSSSGALTLHVMNVSGRGRSGRSLNPPNGRGSAIAKAKAFFDEVINVPPSDSSQRSGRKGRIVYIRDYSTLASTASSWYPALLASVRQRRQGPIARPTSPILNPTTIVFGITPPLSPQPGAEHRGAPQNLLGLMSSRSPAPTVINLPSRSAKVDYFGENEHADKARERRLRERLRRWERGDVHSDLPSLPANPLEASGPESGRGVVIMGPNGTPLPVGLPSQMLSALQSRFGFGEPPEQDSEDSTNETSPFYRTCVIVPSVRNLSRERQCRIARRREINELTMRMAIGSVGGKIDDEPYEVYYERETIPVDPAGDAAVETEKVGPNVAISPAHDPAKMREQWGTQITPWVTVKDIAYRAVGALSETLSVEDLSASRETLTPTPVPWSEVIRAWDLYHDAREARKSWVHESTGKHTEQESEANSDGKDQSSPQVDEVVQRVKEDPDLSTHEQRLLSCIVDSASMPTSFSQVHLPPHTIDSVRTIVSLPLLHPGAFQQGILKQHSMTGCLLFGPPGTGKTLVVRALAKEAGCRMLAVAPSDVMDMYVGEGEKLVKAVFSLARRLSPCVVFLDEIDALFGARSSARETGGALAHHGVITEFMQEMDGLKTNKDTNVIVIGATNRPFDLDDAVLRRLPRRLLVDLPGEPEREEILKILLRDETLADDVDLKALAKRTDLFSGSDLKHLCVSAALDAVKEGVTLPWTVPPSKDSASTTQADSAQDASTAEEEKTETKEGSEGAAEPTMHAAPAPRVLRAKHFDKALKEITPSSSESLGTLTALRKWNEEFGEGRAKKRRIMWGKGSFGFTETGLQDLQDGRVSVP